jgi:hypothetical protein
MMSNRSVSEAEVKQFILDWYRKLDVHPPVEEMLDLVADEQLVMRMPERTFHGHDGFKTWYQSVDQFRDQSHTVKALKIVDDQSTATVKVITRWKRSDSCAANPETRLTFYAAQTWTIERWSTAEKLRIVAYNVDYFLEEYQLGRERSPDQDLELWKHYASFGGQDKNTMVTIASWLLAGSVAMLAFIWNELISTKALDINSILTIAYPTRALGIAGLGAGVSTLAAYISLLYGGYANRNWEKADRIAANRGWKDLLPSHDAPSGYSLNAIARRWARDCEPEKTLPPVFRWYFRGAVGLCGLHLVFIFSSAAKIWG